MREAAGGEGGGLAAGMQTATSLSAGMGGGAFFLLDWPALEP